MLWIRSSTLFKSPQKSEMSVGTAVARRFNGEKCVLDLVIPLLLRVKCAFGVVKSDATGTGWTERRDAFGSKVPTLSYDVVTASRAVAM